MSSGLAGFYMLYQTSFNPALPFANALQAVDDVNGLNPAIFRSLTAGTPHPDRDDLQQSTTGPFTDTITVSASSTPDALCGGSGSRMSDASRCREDGVETQSPR